MELEVVPSGILTRVRSVQVHGSDVQESLAGNRTALNLAGVKKEDLDPGDFLVTPGTLEASNRFDAQFTYLPATSTQAKPLESGSTVHVAHGTREVTGRLLLMDGLSELAPGQTAFAQIRLDVPLPVSRNDRFIIRSFSPVRVIGGGTVLNSIPHHRTNLKDADRSLLAALTESDNLAISHAIIDSYDIPISATEISRIANIPAQRIVELLESEVETAKRPEYTSLGTNHELWAKRTTVQRHIMAMENILVAFHANEPAATGMAINTLKQRYPRHLPDECFRALLEEAIATGKLVLEKNEVSHPKAGAGARNLEKQAADSLYTVLHSHGTTPPPAEDAFKEAGLDAAQGRKALLALEQQGRALRVNKTYCFTAESLQQLQEATVKCLQEKGDATATELKDAMGTSRKYAIPLLEYFDEKRITKRSGDERSLA